VSDSSQQTVTVLDRPAGGLGNIESATRVDVAVVIPAFNEAGGVGAIVRRVNAALGATPCAFDVVVVDD